MLAAQNALRKSLRERPLSWSNQLAMAAQAWADQLLKSGKFEHSHTGYGENLFEVTGPHAHVAPEEAVREWAAEASNYDYPSNRCRSVCGHYTQIVWNSSLEVGCAVARSNSREIFVCEYSPPGNVVGRRPY